MSNKLVETKDGSDTLFNAKYNQHYHSTHGALQESMHVFIEAGLKAHIHQDRINILEMGFGTGLNALLSYYYKERREIYYTGLEAEPVEANEYTKLNYASLIDKSDAEDIFLNLHQLKWNKFHRIEEGFYFQKVLTKIQDFVPEGYYDVIYFDAFAPDAQPELWTDEIFGKIYKWSSPNAILVTYSAKGDVRRALQRSGFQVEKLPGPPGKREMLRAQKVEFQSGS